MECEKIYHVSIVVEKKVNFIQHLDMNILGKRVSVHKFSQHEHLFGKLVFNLVGLLFLMSRL